MDRITWTGLFGPEERAVEPVARRNKDLGEKRNFTVEQTG